MSDDQMTDAMSVEDFLAFTETRPDDEKWELIDGEAILNASPNLLHQQIVLNVGSALDSRLLIHGELWQVVPGVTVRVSDRGAPVPDVIVRRRDGYWGNVCDDIVVAFEVLSASTYKRDLGWKKKAYALVPSLQRYVVIAQEERTVLSFSRANNWKQERLTAADATVDLRECQIDLPLRAIYRYTGLV